METAGITTGNLIVSLITVIVMFIPIGMIIWRFSKIAFSVEANKSDIEKLSGRINSRVDKIDERFIENEAKLSNIEITMGRLEEKMNLLLTRIKG
jgi:hypothetical protein